MDETEQTDKRRSLLARIKAYPGRIFWALSMPGATRKLLALALLVGLITGLVSCVFQWLIDAIAGIAYGAQGSIFTGPWRWAVLFIPALGGLLVGLLVTRFAREARGHGVPEVMLAVARRGGKIRPVVGVVKALASAICIGSGGSAGKEGPIVQIGSAFGSSVGQLFRMPGGMTKMLVACGAAGGISATFATPIAGVLFAMEVILQEFAASAFSMVVISSVTASAVSRLILGEGFFFHVPVYDLVSHWELFLFAALGAIAALYARAFVKILYKIEDVFDGIRMPEWLKPALGGLLLGAMGIAMPQVLGTGHEATEAAMLGHLGALSLIVLSAAKILATSLTLGSGGSGGVFSPSLFIGAMLGGFTGRAFSVVLPGIVGSPGAYALVGMGALFAGATRAPITAIIIVFEMTNDYEIILPVMTAVVIATLVSRLLSEETIYTLKLIRRGIRLGAPKEDALAMMAVRDVMREKFESIGEDTKLVDLIDRIQRGAQHGFPVVDGQGKLAGLITFAQVRAALSLIGELGEMVVAGELMLAPPPVAFPDESIAQIAERLEISDVDRLPVVDPDDPGRIIGLITHGDIIRAYRSRIGKARDDAMEGMGI